MKTLSKKYTLHEDFIKKKKYYDLITFKKNEKKFNFIDAGCLMARQSKECSYRAARHAILLRYGMGG